MEKIKKKVIKSLILLIVAAAFFITVCVTYVLAWFADNPNTQTNNIDINVSGDLDITIEISNDDVNWGNPNEIIFENVFSGQANTKTLYVRLLLNDVNDINLSLSFFSPNGIDGKEVPYIENSLYYYLGSQMQISDIRIISGGEEIADPSLYAVGKGKYLVNTTSEGVVKGQATSVSEAVASLPSVNIVGNYPLSVGITTVFEIDFTFVDNGANQSIYQNPANFVCSRRLMLGWEVA